MVPSLSKHQKVGLATAIVISTIKKDKRKRKMWMKKYLQIRDNFPNLQVFNVLDESDIKNYLRIGASEFNELLTLVTPFIEKKDTILRKSVSAKQRLAVTLRFLATGCSYHDLSYSSLISQSLLSQIIPETCWAIYHCLQHFIKMPSNEEEWTEISKQFETRWNFSHCVGACDGKHIAIEKPPKSGSLFYNYKGFFSVVLFALVNANYEFMYVNTGTNGSVADAAILKSTGFYQKMITGGLHLPPPSPLPGTATVVPYVFLGDSAFALHKNFMKPFPLTNLSYEKRIFNYRLSRARRVVENAFGILASRFRVFRRPLNLHLKNIDAVVMACCVLHNYLRRRVPTYTQIDTLDNELANTVASFTPLEHNMPNQEHNETASVIRNKFVNYFNTEGVIAFQDRMINVLPM